MVSTCRPSTITPVHRSCSRVPPSLRPHPRASKANTSHQFHCCDRVMTSGEPPSTFAGGEFAADKSYKAYRYLKWPGRRQPSSKAPKLSSVRVTGQFKSSEASTLKLWEQHDDEAAQRRRTPQERLSSGTSYLLRNGLPQERLGVGHWSLVLVWCRALADLFIGQPAGICS